MAFITDKRADKAGLKQVMRMACVMCQIAPIKADLYFFSPPGEGEKESQLKVKNSAKKRKKKERD